MQDLVSAGHVSELKVFSLQLRLRSGSFGTEEAVFGDLLELVKRFRPDVLLVQHAGSMGFTRRRAEQIRQLVPGDIIYHEGDPYSRFLHPLPRSARYIAQVADVVLTVGAGVFRDNFVRAGCLDVRWVPHIFEPDRIEDRPYTPTAKDLTAVMIANRNRPRFRGLPNWRDRIALVHYMEGRYGSRFGIFGEGWTGPSSQGPVPFSRQQDALARSWVSVNWDHYAEENMYFSNRLPISLAAGSLHVTTLHSGYDEYFGSESADFLAFAANFSELGDQVDHWDSLTRRELQDRQEAARQFAYSHFRQDHQLVQLLNSARPWVDPGAAQDCWRIGGLWVKEV